jgi:hypothetical protein
MISHESDDAGAAVRVRKIGNFSDTVTGFE